MNKKWQIYDTNQEKIEEIENRYNLNKLLATILVNRNITTKKDIELFLKPTREDFYNPFLIKDMDIAIKRIIKAIENQEKVTIYGDYDVDGITSITVLKSFLKDVGLEAKHYIPNRLNEGYGLNKPAIEKIAQEGCDLMITVDCGISGNNEIEYANSLGIETIITDHHEPGNELPKAFAVIDNKRKDSEYPFRELAGVGVVFKVIQALGKTLGLKERSNHLSNELSGGQQQRTSIGRALINRPSIVLADEPTGNLDSKNSKEVLELLKLSVRKYNQTLIMITHDPSIALQADRVITIEDGTIKQDEVI